MVGSLIFAAGADADGDPASDVLLYQDVYTTYSFTGPSLDRLKASVADAFASRLRIKVAVIATRNDLGSIPSLFGRPAEYARFLGTELRGAYIGPLLVVMPAGFGIYDGGRSVGPEQQVLKKLDPGGRSPATLTSAAADAVDELLARNALTSKDILAPVVYPRVPFAKAGQPVKLSFGIVEDSERASAVVAIFSGSRQLAMFRGPLRHVVFTQEQSVTWRVPDPVPANLRFCVRATDGSGNRGPQLCLPIKLG